MQTTIQIIQKNNDNLLRRLCDKVRISEQYDFNPKFNPLNEVYQKPLSIIKTK